MGLRFSLWNDIKAYARAYAGSARALPVDDEAKMWLHAVVNKHVPFEQLGPEAFEFYVAELQAMIAADRRQRSA